MQEAGAPGACRFIHGLSGTPNALRLALAGGGVYKPRSPKRNVRPGRAAEAFLESF
jgi:hypothetical protein